jgi:hypothetical protein
MLWPDGIAAAPKGGARVRIPPPAILVIILSMLSGGNGWGRGRFSSGSLDVAF